MCFFFKVNSTGEVQENSLMLVVVAELLYLCSTEFPSSSMLCYVMLNQSNIQFNASSLENTQS